MDQQSFLRWAKIELGMSSRELADQLGVSASSIASWSLRKTSRYRRAMPLMAIRMVLRMLDDLKPAFIARGDCVAAEAIDAIGVQMDPSRFAECMRKFDALQRAANRIAVVEPSQRKS